MKHCKDVPSQQQFNSNCNQSESASMVSGLMVNDDIPGNTMQQDLRFILNRLSLERMLFGSGEFPPASFNHQGLEGKSGHKTHETGSDDFSEPQETAYHDDPSAKGFGQHHLSLERMLFGAGEFPPASFANLDTQDGNEQAINDKAGKDLTGLQDAANTEDPSINGFGRNRLSLERMLFGSGEFPPASFHSPRRARLLDDDLNTGTDFLLS